MSTTTEKGREGEQLALAYLQGKGYALLAANYRYKRSEIDLIVSDGKFLVFVEVKMRKNYAFGYPEQAVTPQKEQMILRAAEQFMASNPSALWPRYDIVSILSADGHTAQEIVHLEDAFGY